MSTLEEIQKQEQGLAKLERNLTLQKLKKT